MAEEREPKPARQDQEPGPGEGQERRRREWAPPEVEDLPPIEDLELPE